MRKPFALLFVLAISFNAFAREDTVLDSGWKFAKGDADLSSQPIIRAELVGANWQTVSIPHCWGWQELQDGATNYYRGPGWYRRELDVTPEQGKRYYLRFEAASSVADVYLNGQFIGEHRGAFGAFCFEITTNLSASGTNLLMVRVDNAPQPDVAPLSGDFPVYGGIYRPVHLITTEANCFTVTDHASPGVEWRETNVSKRQALLDVVAEVANGTRHPETLTLVASVFDANGKCVATTNQTIFLATNRTAEPCWLRVIVPKPHLWNGRLDPYLYRAVVELRSTNGVHKVWDTVEQSIGLRFYRVDPDKGFFLNGKPYALHGVDKHQDRWNKGWAVSDADLDQDIALIKEIGATVIRCAHYQHSDYFYSLCDRAGILVWAEIPQVNEITANDPFENTSANQLRDLIRQNINHPSIFVWSLFNEQRPSSPDPEREIRDMNIIAHGEDPTRPTIAATMTDQLPQMNKIPDLLGWNMYPGWYGKPGDMTNFNARLDKVRYSSRHGGFCMSEYGAGANAFQHEQNPTQPVTTGQWHPEEWQAIVHEKDWAVLKSKPYIWATFVWNIFDFASPVRHEGGVFNRNDKGLVTADRKIKKDAFFFYKANWSDEPVLYITSRRFTERTNAVTDVKIYSNAKKVELLVNGASLGKRSNATNCVFVWKNVSLKPGENQIAAKARRDGKDLSDSCVWTLKNG
jgi:beta-galactosidase